MSTKKVTIEDLGFLCSSNIHMKNESSVLEKINEIISQGTEKLQFVTDYDQTVTKQHQNGVPSLHCYEVFFRWENLPQSSVDAISAVNSELRASFNPAVKIEKRKEVFDKMYKTIHKETQGVKFDQREMKSVVCKYGQPLRDRTSELFLQLKNLNVPVLIFSAASTDVINEQLKLENINYDNVQIIANSFKFNGSMLDGLQNYENLVTPFNKHEHFNEIKNSELLKNRKNIILMGDSTEDATIVREIENVGTVLKIGFCYNQTRERLEVYKDLFDIVLNDDQTMDVILDIIKLF